MGVKCTHYKLCSVQPKLVYFSQFLGMKHFLGPVCDIWPRPLFFQLLKGFEQVSCHQTIQNKDVPEPRPNYIKEKSSQVIDYAIIPNGL